MDTKDCVKSGLMIPFHGDLHIVEIHRWLKDYGVKHGPTVRRENGWFVTILEDPDQTASMALKLLIR